jgi:hypothetical protein
MVRTTGRRRTIAEIDRRIAAPLPRHHPAGMFVVSDAEAAAIRAAFDGLAMLNERQDDQCWTSLRRST